MKIMVIFLIIFSLLPSSDAEATPIKDEFFAQGLRAEFADDLVRFPDVPHYQFDLTLLPDFTQARLSGSLELTYTNTTSDTLNELVFRLYPNLDSFGGQATLSQIRVGEIPVSASYDETETIATIRLPQPLTPQAQIVLTLQYNAVVFHGEQQLYRQYSYLETELALASTLPLLSVYRPSSGWWQEIRHPRGDAVYSETAHFDVTLAAPAYLKVITSGALVEERTEEVNNMIVRRYAAPLMRDFSIMASANYQTISAQFEDIQVNIHYLSDAAGAEAALQWTLDSMTAFTQAYGNYVYSELDVVETYTSAGGIEYPGLIVVANDLWRADEFYFEVVTVHEVAHQWWYSMVGNDQTLYPFLDEALTEYSVSVYWRYIGGEAGYEAAISAEQQRFESFAGGAEMKIGFTPSDYNTETYSRIVYGKGAYFFHTLSTVLGQDIFLTAIQRYLSDYRYGIATPFDLQTVLETTSGMQLDALFLEWVGYSN